MIGLKNLLNSEVLLYFLYYIYDLGDLDFKSSRSI